MINRSAVILKCKEPFVRWINEAEPFEVNPMVIEIRIRQESFAEKLKDYYR